MLTLRFKREGAKKKNIFRLVAADSKQSSASGKALEILGWFNPHDRSFDLNKSGIKARVSQGAVLSPAVHNILVKLGIITDKKIPHHKGGKGEPKPKELQPELENTPNEVVLEKPVAEPETKPEEKTEDDQGEKAEEVSA